MGLSENVGSSLTHVLKGIDKIPLKVFKPVAEEVKDYAVSITPRDSGATKESWEVKVSNRYRTAMLRNKNGELIVWLSEGTEAHWIEPLDPKGWLAWDKDGQTFFSKGHEVSGIKGNAMIPRIIAFAERRLKQAMNLYLSRLVNKRTRYRTEKHTRVTKAELAYLKSKFASDTSKIPSWGGSTLTQFGSPHRQRRIRSA